MNWKTEHHQLSKDAWWSNEKINRQHINEHWHRYLHLMVKTMPPHMIIELMIAITGKCFTEETKQQILEIINIPEPENLYKPWVIKDIQRFKKACQKYLYIKYIKA